MNREKGYAIISLTVMFILIWSLCIPVPIFAACRDESPTATNAYTFYWGKASVEGKELRSGDEVRAYVDSVDMNTGCVGKCVIEKTGLYGSMAIYGDDSTTSKKDGAKNGDVIHFVVCQDGVEYECEETSVWNPSDELVELNLSGFASETK